MSSEGENICSTNNSEKCLMVLVDVAGTTTSLNFVKETLFPFVVKNAETFVKAKFEEEPVKEFLNQIEDNLDVDKAIEKIKALTLANSDNEGLKNLQGLIYQEGYEKGDLKAHVFDDVLEAFEDWAKNRKVSIYSTGSVESQKLLFSHTTQGDISCHIHKYFDQKIGSKTDSESYKKIAKEVEVAPEEITFVTDDIKEATAAKEAGLVAVLIKREGNAKLPETTDFTVISSFKDLAFDKTAKRKIEEETASEEAPPSKVPKTETEGQVETDKKTESMEVDQAEEKNTSEKTETVAQETENLEKTDVEMKEETKSETPVTETPKEEKKDETKEEAQIENEKEETKAEEVKQEETTAEEAKQENTKTEEAKLEETKTEEMKQEETTKDAKQGEAKPEESKPKETVEKVEETEAAKSSETETAKTEEKKEEKEDKEEKIGEERKEEAPSENGDKKENDEKSNEEEKPTENGAVKVEEKENESVLANGVDSGKEETEVTSSEPTEAKAEEDSEIKVKKLEETVESKTVSVEV